MSFGESIKVYFKTLKTTAFGSGHIQIGCAVRQAYDDKMA